jgi:hypothetical protein
MTQYIHPENTVFELAKLHQSVFEVTDACNLKYGYCAYKGAPLLNMQ